MDYVTALDALETFRIDIVADAEKAIEKHVKDKWKRRINAINIAILALHQREDKIDDEVAKILGYNIMENTESGEQSNQKP